MPVASRSGLAAFDGRAFPLGVSLRALRDGFREPPRCEPIKHHANLRNRDEGPGYALGHHSRINILSGGY